MRRETNGETCAQMKLHLNCTADNNFVFYAIQFRSAIDSYSGLPGHDTNDMLMQCINKFNLVNAYRW